MVKGIYELWGYGTTYEELEKSVREYPDERKLPFLVPESSFKIVIDSFGKVISSQEQNEIIQSLTYIPFKVDDIIFSISIGADLVDAEWYHSPNQASPFCFLSGTC